VAPIQSIGDIPFRQRPVLELLNLDVRRDAPDLDYAGFGHARAAEIVLETRDGARRVVAEPLILAVHSDDDPEPLDGDIELAFDDGDPDGGVAVLLSDFLRVWLPRLRGDERAIVLVACNPHRAHLPRPAGAPDVPVFYALGDVESWLEGDDRRQTLHLVAEAWRTAG
jgi:hypothetical protein